MKQKAGLPFSQFPGIMLFTRWIKRTKDLLLTGGDTELRLTDIRHLHSSLDDNALNDACWQAFYKPG
jgi:hypothetical protein